MASGTEQLRALAAALGRMPRAGFDAAEKATGKAADDLKTDWVANARATSGQHGKYYPDAITAEPKFGIGSISAEVGPEEGRPQGGMGMGFEYGSRNQPPHMDGNRAADVHEPLFAQAILDAVTDAIDNLL